MYLSRRKLITLAAFSASMYGIAPTSAISMMASIQAEQKIGIGLFTVRDRMARDPLGTLKILAKIGFQEVEFSALGYYDYAPCEMKKILSDLGLVAPSRLVRLPHIRDHLNETLDMAADAGHKYVVLAYLNKNERTTLDQYKSYVDLFSHVGQEANKRDLRFGYHNHAYEFSPMEGIIPYDMLLDQVADNLMTLTMDFYHISKAGKDPLDYFRKYPGRFSQWHIKDRGVNGDMVDAGTGLVDFPAAFAMADIAGLRHIYMEDRRQRNTLSRAKNTFAYLKKVAF